MKTRIFCLLFTALSAAAMAKNLQARLAHGTFYAPGKGPYIETYLSVAGKSVVFAPLSNGKYQASIEVTIVMSQNDQVKYFDKYNLLSPEADDSVNTHFNFLDQQRIQLPNGKYKFELTIKDKNQGSKPYNVSQDVNIDFHQNVVAISDIVLLEDYRQSSEETKIVKGGYELIPLVDNFFPETRNALKFYTEIYNTASVLSNDGFVLSYFVETAENHQVLNSFSRLQRMQGKEVSAIIKDLDITELPSGNYNLVVEARNRNNELLASKQLFFQRSKPLSNIATTAEVGNTFAGSITNADSLAEYIKYLRPISGSRDVQFADRQLESADLNTMQKYFYDFWQRKDPANPAQAWLNYKAEVEKVNASYSTTNRKGYATDRGRVYLQYGPPNQISQNYNEPESYPYEIWHYYKLENQTNRKFVFYNTDLSSNDYILLHSDAQGEPFDTQWQLRLKQRTETNNDYDRTNSRNTWGKKSDDLYRNPR
jgi:GWxTD domain-containing protein